METKNVIKNVKKIMVILSILLLFIAMSSIQNTKATTITNSNIVEDQEKSNNYLKSLNIEDYEISPEFNKNTTVYYVNVEKNVTSLNINAIAENENSTVKITGNTNITKTENNIKVTVTSENKKIKTYLVIVTKQENNGVKLSELTINGATLNPNFSENKYYYTASIQENNEISKLDIVAKPLNSTSTVEIIGNDESLQEGENIITIIVRDDENITSYQICANITVEKTIISEAKNNEYIAKIKEYITNFFQDKNKTIAFLISVAIILFILIIVFIRKIIKKNKAEEQREQIKRRAK